MNKSSYPITICTLGMQLQSTFHKTFRRASWDMTNKTVPKCWIRCKMAVKICTAKINRKYNRAADPQHADRAAKRASRHVCNAEKRDTWPQDTLWAMLLTKPFTAASSGSTRHSSRVHVQGVCMPLVEHRHIDREKKILPPLVVGTKCLRIE